MNAEPRLQVLFYRTATGNEPVREWLKALPPAERKINGLIKKSEKMPLQDLQVARQRLQSLGRE